MKERGRPRSFDRQAALTRAMEMFWEKGYEGTSISDLTRALGIGSPSLYAAFGSKEALFRESVALYGATEGAELWEPVAKAPTARAAIAAFLLETARVFTRRSKPRGCLVVLSALQMSEDSAVVRRELVALRARTIESLAARFALARDAGEIAADADLHALARYYVTVQQGMSIQARDGATRAQLEAVAGAALSAWEPLTQAPGASARS